jgi:DNA-directed RNA polymerase subunit beta'
MAVHVPLTNAAQAECWTLMLSAATFWTPRTHDDRLSFQEYVLGINFLTRPKKESRARETLLQRR